MFSQKQSSKRNDPTSVGFDRIDSQLVQLTRGPPGCLVMWSRPCELVGNDCN